MASACSDTGDTGDDDQMKCPICLQVYIQPKSLPCLHVFCETCLISYFTSSCGKNNKHDPNSDISNSPSCPVCRTAVTLSYVSSKPEEWIPQLPINEMITELIDRNKHTMNQGRSCDPCLFEDKEVNASSWCVDCCEALCEDCVRAHKKMKSSRAHKHISLDEYESQPPRINVSKICETHPDKKLEIFCVDHQMPCCLVCMTTHHRKCGHVITLEEAAKGVSESSEMKQLMARLVEESSKFQEVVNDKQIGLQALKEQKLECESEIAKLKTDVVCHIEKLEQTFKDDLNILSKGHCSELQEELDHFEHLKKTRDTYISLLETSKSTTTDINIFLEMVAIQRLVQEQYENLKQKFPVLKQIKYTMEAREMARSVASSFQALAVVRVDLKELNTSELFQSGIYGNVDFAKCTLKETNSLHLQKTGVKFADVAYLGEDKVMLTDMKRMILTICMEDGTLVSEKMFSYGVHSVAVLSEHEIAVTLPDEKSFIIIDIDDSSHKSYKIGEKCHGITSFKNKLVMACKSTILFADMTGKVLSRKNVPFFVDFVSAVSNDRLCYTNHVRSSVHCIDGDETDIFSYRHKDMKYPYGVSADGQCNIYIAGNSSGNIHQLSSDGQLIQILNPGIPKPRGIAFKPNSNKMLICSDQEVKEYEMVSSS